VLLRVRTCAKSPENGRVRDGDGLDCAEERYPCGQPYGRLSSVQKSWRWPEALPGQASVVAAFTLSASVQPVVPWAHLLRNV
jgi:hypothetical protein